MVSRAEGYILPSLAVPWRFTVSLGSTNHTPSNYLSASYRSSRWWYVSLRGLEGNIQFLVCISLLPICTPITTTYYTCLSPAIITCRVYTTQQVGSVSVKNTKNILIKNIGDATLGAICWWLFGYGVALGDTAGETTYVLLTVLLGLQP